MSVQSSVVVLMATFNGAQWLEEQIRSIFAQEGVRVKIIASDDQSRDKTMEVLRKMEKVFPMEILPPAPHRFGNANRNFMRLISDIELGDGEYFALADQDDIWLPRKLERAIKYISEHELDAYSSDVIAFWPDGRKRLLIKSHKQKSDDFLFESAGPGCTFVFPRSRFEELQLWVRSHRHSVDAVKVHDWLIYAYARSRSWRWFVDAQPNLLYRQHSANEAGANIGWRAARRRINSMLNGHYVRDSLAIAHVLEYNSSAVSRMESFKLRDRLILAMCAWRFRRRVHEQIFLAASFLLMSKE